MRLRMWIFSVLALLAAGWLCYGLVIVPQATNQTLQQAPKTGDNAAYKAGAAIGGGIGLTFFACTGLPLFALFSLLAWRNQAGLRTEQRHQEQLDVLHQQAQAQTAQAQIQFAQYQQSQPPQRPVLAAPDDATVRAQMQAAKALIVAKQFREARALLTTIPTPTAREWLAKLDERGV